MICWLWALGSHSNPQATGLVPLPQLVGPLTTVTLTACTFCCLNFTVGPRLTFPLLYDFFCVIVFH
jgi:hypothetical protein